MSEPLDLPTREGYDLWSQIYDDEDNPLIALETTRIYRAGGFVLVSDLHPAMRLLGTQAQFTDPATGRKTRPAGARHQLSDYVLAATRAGSTSIT